MDQQNNQSSYSYNPAAAGAYAAQPQPAAQPAAAAQPQPTAQPAYAVPQPAYAAPAPAPAPQKKSRRWLIPVIVLVVLILITALAVGSCTKAVLSLGSGSNAVVTTGPTVAVVALDAEIAYDGSVCSPEGFKDVLDQAEEDDNIKALVLRVNSGGGTATAGEEMTTYLQQFSKPVVVSSASINASAAYMISSQADYIYTARSTAIGAIGTAMQVISYGRLMELLGIDVQNIVSSESKDSSYGTRTLTEEEQAYYQAQVDQINDMFIKFVAEGRHMGVDQVEQLATGLSFTGTDAVANGIADEIGTLEDACNKAADLAGISTYDMVFLGLTDTTLTDMLGLGGANTNNASGAAALSTGNTAATMKE
ncbi:MAG: signal peptide peptidase SppA [Coriobacteriia bacterium]|nr:signal peptide peptidase SppA [Coriobacteriia bacterium]